MCGNEPKTGDSKVGKRQEQAEHQETPDEGHLKRDGAALIPNQGRGGQFIFSSQNRFFSQSVTLGVTLTFKRSGIERLLQYNNLISLSFIAAAIGIRTPTSSSLMKEAMRLISLTRQVRTVLMAHVRRGSQMHE